MTIILRIAAFCIAMFAATAFAQTYPNRFVRIIVPFPAGGPTDVMARLIGQKLSEKLGQQFVVENIGGAGGNIGMGNAARAAGDGYTILFVSSSYVVNPSLYHKVPYDPDKDFVPITKAAGAPNALIAHPSVPARSVQELVALIKADPARFNIASPGIGTTPHLSIELFKQAFGLDDLTVVPFGGGNPAIQAVVAGHTPLSFQAVPPATALIKEGKLHALAITAAKRSSALPDVPTFDESGFPGLEVDNWFGIVAPANTPKETLNQFAGWLKAALQDPDVKAKLALQGLYPVGMCGDEFAAYIRNRFDDYGEMIRESNIKAQ